MRVRRAVEIDSERESPMAYGRRRMSEPSRMKVLVTATTATSARVAPMLMEAGHDVTGLDTFFYEGCDLLDDAVDVPTLRMDLRDVTTDVLEGQRASSIWRRCRTTRSVNSMRN